MKALFLATLLLQSPSIDPLEYLRTHAAADSTLVEGRTAAARTGFERCLEMSPQNPTVAYALACVETRAGNLTGGIAWLEQAVAWGYADAEVAMWDEDLAPLREYGRFSTALDEMRAQAVELKVLVPIVDERGVRVQDLAVDPTGTRVALGLRKGVVRILDARTGLALRDSPPLGHKIWSLDFDPSGDRLAVLTTKGNLHFWPIDASAEPTSAPALSPRKGYGLGFPSEAFVEFDPAGEHLLVAAGNRGASLWTADGHNVRTWEEPVGTSTEIAWRPDGARIAFARGMEVCFVDGRTGEPVGTPLVTTARVCSLACSPDGKLLATGHTDNYLRVWDLDGLQPVFAHYFQDDWGMDLWVNAVAFSPDGRHVAGGTGETAYVDVLEIPSGKPAAHFDWHGGHWNEPYELRWTSDSQRLWFAFSCGSVPIDEVRLKPELPASSRMRAHSPRVGPSGAAIGNGTWYVFALAPDTGRCLWNRPSLGREGEILQAASGHFTGNVQDLEKLFVVTDLQGEQIDPLAPLVTQLFDPKRVRAARAGVALSAQSF